MARAGLSKLLHANCTRAMACSMDERRRESSLVDEALRR
jgi:hypothetical protein